MTTVSEVSPVIDKKKSKGGRPLSSIWEDINKGESVGSGKFSASCKYCEVTWKRGDISKLEEHLSNHCKNAPATVVRNYMSKILERQDKATKKRKLLSGQQNIDDYHDSTDLPGARITRINRALIKFFVSCGISFRIVEHPFFINFIKELNGGYDPPTRELLAGQMLERELAQVNNKVKTEIESETNLTIAFDGWTSHTHRSIWNFIVMTPSRKEYLYQLSDLSERSHTAEYLSSVIEKVIVNIGVDRISAVVSDNASNVRKAREIIQDKFPTIENVRCIAHCINLIACDIVKEDFGDRLLRRVNILTSFFKNSHQANSKLTELIKKKGIVGGGLKSYCKTRWTTASESVNSVINLEQILIEIVTNNHNLLTNDSIARIIQSRNFFPDLRILAFVLEPLRKAVLALEARSATLADCFLSLARLAAVLNKLPKSFNPSFRSHCVKVINGRFNEFDDDKYITCFFLDPRFRSAALKKVSFKKIIKCVAAIGKRLGFDLYEIGILLDQLQKYKNEEDPFDLDLSIAKQSPLNWWKLIATDPEPELLPKVACHLLSICPNSATCERGFSTLGWLFERRLNLKLATLESMCKLITYWKSNFKTELGYYGIDQRKNTRLSDDEINIRIAEAFNEIDEDDKDDEFISTHKSTGGEKIPKDNCYVLIEPVWIDKFIDLSHDLIIKDIDIPKDLDDFDENMNDDNGVCDDADGGEDEGKGFYDYDVDDLLDTDEEEEED